MTETEDSAARLRRAALNWLARRDYARSELGQRLVRKFGEDSGIEELLDWLEEQNFVNDARFASSFVRARIERGQGEKRIRNELGQRGVAQDRVDDALAEANCDWFELARAVHQRKFRAGPGDNDREKARQLRFLQQRGFSGEQAFQAIDAAPEPAC